MTQGGVRVRVAVAGEATRLLEPYSWLFAQPGSTPPDWSAEQAIARIERTVESPRAEVLLAEDSSQVLGFATVYLDIVSVRFGQRAWVEDLAVHPDRRRQGIGARLLDAAQGWARQHGATHLELESGEARVDAHRFYEREQVSWTARCFIWKF